MSGQDNATAVQTTLDRIKGLPESGRRMIAIAGPPAAGKSTLAADLTAALGPSAALVPMDGFHYDNAILEARGVLAKKGAPGTFDLEGFAAMLDRLGVGGAVAIPSFDRALDKAIASSIFVGAEQTTLIVEGNYLLLDEPGWRDLKRHWAYSVFLDVPKEVLEARLVQRWIDHGHDADMARVRALGNDIPNAMRVIEARLDADLVL